MTDIKATLNQLTIAHRLAVAHGHAWAAVIRIPGDAPDACAPNAIHIDDLVGIPLADASARISAASIEACPHWPGITAPTWDADGDIIHTTGSGRLSWLVQANGATTLNVWRPGDSEACSASLGFDGVVERVSVDSQTCLIRHAETLTEAIAALTGRPFSDVRGELADLYRVAVDNQRSEVASLAERLVADAERLWFRISELADASDDPIEARDLSPEMMAWMSSAFSGVPK